MNLSQLLSSQLLFFFSYHTQDLIIFPGEADFIKIPQCTTGRVYLLKFKDHSSRRFFYWMQEPSTSKDDDLAKKVLIFLFS